MRRISMPDEGIESLFGSFDENLRNLESALGVTLRTSGHDIVIEGNADGVSRAERALGQLAGLLRNGYRFARGDVKTAAQLLAQDPNVELQEYFQKGSSRTAGRRQVAPASGGGRARRARGGAGRARARRTLGSHASTAP